MDINLITTNLLSMQTMLNNSRYNSDSDSYSYSPTPTPTSTSTSAFNPFRSIILTGGNSLTGPFYRSGTATDFPPSYEEATLGGQIEFQNRPSCSVLRDTKVYNKKIYCSICLKKSDSDIVRELKCNHVFHIGCIDEWLSNHNTCPLCKN